MPRFRASRAASPCVPVEENCEGMVTPVTLAGAERVAGDRGHERRVDAAREAQHHVGEPVLGHVVAGAEDEGPVDLLHRLEHRHLVRRAAAGRSGAGSGRQRDAPRRGGGGAQLLLPAPRVVQAGAEDLVEVEVGDHEVLLEGPAARHALALLVEHEGLAVEDQLVLAAHRVHEGQAHQVVGGAGRQHLLAEPPLARVVGRGVDAHHQLRAAQRLQAWWGRWDTRCPRRCWPRSTAFPSVNTGDSVPDWK